MSDNVNKMVFGINARYGFRSDTLANWESTNPILAKGEPGIVEFEKNEETSELTPESQERLIKGEWLKIGDDNTPWSELPWAKGPKGDKGDAGAQGEKGEQGPKGEPGKDAVTDQIYDPESENAQSGKAVAEAISKNVLTGSVAGASVLIDDVSPSQSKLKVQLSSLGSKINLFDFTELTVNGSESVSAPENIGDILKTGGTYTLAFDYLFSGTDNFTFGESYSEVMGANLGIRTENIYTNTNEEGYEAYAYEDITSELADILAGNVTEYRHKAITFTIPSEAQVTNDSIIVFMGIYGIHKGNDEYGSLLCHFKNIAVYEGAEEVGEITDFSAVKLLAHGKNLFDKDSYTTKHRYVDIKDFEIGESITISTEETYDFKVATAVGATAIVSKPNTNTATFTITEEIKTCGKLWIVNKKTYGAETVENLSGQNVMLERGKIATTYEPYVASVEYAVSAEGLVENINVIKPTTVLETDTANVKISCTYEKDINKAFAELARAIISLGGNI